MWYHPNSDDYYAYNPNLIKCTHYFLFTYFSMSFYECMIDTMYEPSTFQNKGVPIDEFNTNICTNVVTDCLCDLCQN